MVVKEVGDYIYYSSMVCLKASGAARVNSYEVSWSENPRYKATFNAMTPGKAKGEAYRRLHEVICDLEYTSLRVRKLGGPHTSEDFLRTAKYRGVPFARCGMKVECDGRPGVIVGSNSSANFDVYFTGGENKGLVLNCHPNWMMKYEKTPNSGIFE